MQYSAFFRLCRSPCKLNIKAIISRINYDFFLILLEPTSNIKPKVPGKKYEGGEIVFSHSGKSVFLTCPVVGFPVPFFK